MYCSSSPCSTAYRYSRWISPVPANSGSCPLGSVWTWSPISSVVTGAAVPLRVGEVCHTVIAATAVAPAPYRNTRRFIDGSSSSSGRLICPPSRLGVNRYRHGVLRASGRRRPPHPRILGAVHAVAYRHVHRLRVCRLNREPVDRPVL